MAEEAAQKIQVGQYGPGAGNQANEQLIPTREATLITALTRLMTYAALSNLDLSHLTWFSIIVCYEELFGDDARERANWLLGDSSLFFWCGRKLLSLTWFKWFSAGKYNRIAAAGKEIAALLSPTELAGLDQAAEDMAQPLTHEDLNVLAQAGIITIVQGNPRAFIADNIMVDSKWYWVISVVLAIMFGPLAVPDAVDLAGRFISFPSEAQKAKFAAFASIFFIICAFYIVRRCFDVLGRVTASQVEINRMHRHLFNRFPQPDLHNQPL